MVSVGSGDEFGVHIAAQTELHAHVLFFYALSKFILDMDDMADPIWTPGKQGIELRVCSGFSDFGKVQGYF